MNDPRILNWRRIDARLTTSGQPDVAALAALRDLGVRHIINLGPHTHERALADERGIVAGLGMGYINIPVPFDAPEETHYAEFCAAMDAHGAVQVHVHCIVNARVTAFLTRYRRDRLGMADDIARAPMDSVWRPGGVWARFVGDTHNIAAPHRYAGRDYPVPVTPNS
ncbi:protein tyrosine phosphatase family protein [Sphingomonas sp.]|uniref:protein tyrosine phosphatase family protein n=1 Tax=Sphingomonas sp. TaxID=28214 RepID=UPI001ECB70B5|nr:protein tyrosine phosphatase family protein [Sphingomonas sp.]MBX3595882.1 protein tyrosine phosphatase family protein [Sphingomonas sp.]